MKLYEGMFLFDSTAVHQWSEVEAEVRRLCNRIQADLEVCVKYDERKLAYEIKRRKRGSRGRATAGAVISRGTGAGLFHGREGARPRSSRPARSPLRSLRATLMGRQEVNRHHRPPILRRQRPPGRVRR